MNNNETKTIENAINFYMLVNNLKYRTNDGKQSIADEIYGAMILAIAINSEYNKVENIATTLRMILLGTMNEYNKKSLHKSLTVMKNKELFTNDIFEYSNSEIISNHHGRFAFDCVTTECMIEYFFKQFLLPEKNIDIDTLPIEEYVKPENINTMYRIAKNYGFTDRFGNDEKKNFEIFRFYYLNRVLKRKIRSGWDENHWNISSERIERISEHIVGTIALALALYSEFDFHTNIDKIVLTLCIHEVGEIKIDDITPFDGMTREEKQKIEHKAMIEVIGNLTKNKEMFNLLLEFDEHKTNESKIAYHCDKLEADIQAKVYQDMGYQHPLIEQQNNVVFKSSKVQEMLQNGAKTAFDIWYEWDKSIYIKEPIFTKTLKHIKETKLK